MTCSCCKVTQDGSATHQPHQQGQLGIDHIYALLTSFQLQDVFSSIGVSNNIVSLRAGVLEQFLTRVGSAPNNRYRFPKQWEILSLRSE